MNALEKAAEEFADKYAVRAAFGGLEHQLAELAFIAGAVWQSENPRWAAKDFEEKQQRENPTLEKNEQTLPN